MKLLPHWRAATVATNLPGYQRVEKAIDVAERLVKLGKDKQRVKLPISTVS